MTESDDVRTDNELVAAARRGDREALEGLVVRHQPRVYRFGVKMCRNAEDAADVLQETLLAMTRTIHDFRGDASVSTWLYTIARSFCIKKRRRSKFAPVEESLDGWRAERREDLSDSAPGPELEAAGREIETALTAAVDALDAGQREVLVLRDVEGLSAPDVARVLGLSVEAVKSRLHRARLAVRQRVAPLFGVDGHGAREPGRCPDVLMLFSQHLEGEIAPELCAEMETHLARCGHCRGACESLKRTLALCRATSAPDVPLSVRESVRDAIRTFLAQQTT